MKKSALSLAVLAALMSAGSAMADSSNTNIYGVVNYSVDIVNVDDGDALTVNDRNTVTGVNNASRIGFKGTEDLGGMKAIWQIETGLGGAGVGDRNTFVGLQGNFGTVIAGKHDTPYKLSTAKLDPFADSIGDYNSIMGATAAGSAATRFDARANTVAYLSPSASGLSAAIAYVGANVSEVAGADDTQAWSLSTSYQRGPLTASLAYETHSGDGLLGATATQKADAWKAGVGYAFDNTRLGLIYEKVDGGADSVESHKSWYASVAHDMGPMTMKAAYGKAGSSDAVAVGGAKFWAAGVDYNLSKRTALYGVYASVKNDDGAAYNVGSYAPAAGLNADGVSFGLKHSF